jgi:CO dehydrogenase nickel-insertion accessory protein CooC1
VGNKVSSADERRFIVENMPDFEVLGFISDNPRVREADIKGLSAFDIDPLVVAETQRLKERLDEIHKGGFGG